MKNKFALAAILSALSFGAGATTTDWGPHDDLEFAATMVSVGSFSDSYLFSVGDMTGLFNTTVANNLTNVLGISGGTIELFKEAGAVDTSFGSYAFNGFTGSISHSFGTLAAGDYYYLVTGDGTGTKGGFYSISSAVIAVPEPETYALLLAGLGAIGFVARRRKG